MTKIQQTLFKNQDAKFRDFQYSLTPSLLKENVIGVRTPVLKKLAKELITSQNTESFLNDLPHKYFEENQLHAFIICLQKDFSTCIQKVEQFLPFIDNWATCDQLNPVVLKKNSKKLLPHIELWLKSTHTYTVRFAIRMLMNYFLDKDFKTQYLETVSKIQSNEYYVKMMIAWYFATALAKQYEKTLPFIAQNRLEPFTHNKTIQKAIESFRIPDEHKNVLKSYRIYKK